MASDNLVITKDNLTYLYRVGDVLLMTIGTSGIPPLVERYRLLCQRSQKEITVFIEQDALLSERFAHASTEGCDCGHTDIPDWNFPILCTLLLPLLLPIILIGGILITRGLLSGALIGYVILLLLVFVLSNILDCWWVQPLF